MTFRVRIVNVKLKPEVVQEYYRQMWDYRTSQSAITIMPKRPTHQKSTRLYGSAKDQLQMLRQSRKAQQWAKDRIS